MISTGQQAQWPQIGIYFLDPQPWTRLMIGELDRVLQVQRNPLDRSLVSELTKPRSTEHLCQPKLSRTLVTALQSCIAAVFERWSVRREQVVGHSSSEIAAA